MGLKSVNKIGKVRNYMKQKLRITLTEISFTEHNIHLLNDICMKKSARAMSNRLYA